MTLDVCLLTFLPVTTSAPGQINSRETGNPAVIPGPTPKQPYEAAEKVRQGPVFVAQPLLAVCFFQNLTKAHSQEWLCYPAFSANCYARITSCLPTIRKQSSHLLQKHCRYWAE
jgi:hypothetical protein